MGYSSFEISLHAGVLVTKQEAVLCKRSETYVCHPHHQLHSHGTNVNIQLASLHNKCIVTTRPRWEPFCLVVLSTLDTPAVNKLFLILPRRFPPLSPSISNDKYLTWASTAVGKAVTCAPVTQRARVRSPVRTGFLGEVFSGFFLTCKINVGKL